MKRLIPFLLLLFCLGCKGVSAAEYDTLFLRNESQIRCTITEMTETAVSYTRADRPRTMVFSTPIEQIARILFSDGTEAQITAATTETTQTQPASYEERTAAQTERVVAAPAVRETTQAATQMTTRTAVATTQPQQKTTVAGQGRIYRDNNEYMFNDKYISEKEVERVLRTNYAAYEEWQKSKRMLTAGWVLTGFSIAGVVGALACIPAGGVAVGSMCGGTVVIACVGLGVCLGSAKHRTKAIDIYNGQIDLAAEWHIVSSQDGVGIALRF